MAAASMKRDGKVTEIAARAMVTHAILKRLAHHFQDIALEFRQLVEEQHAIVPERNFARARNGAASDQGRHR